MKDTGTPWEIPANSEDRLGKYIAAETEFYKAKVEKARPKYDLDAEKNQQIFELAGEYISGRKVGKEAMEKVLVALLKFQIKRRSDIAHNNKELTNDDMSMDKHALVCGMMIGEWADKLLGEGGSRLVTRLAFNEPNLRAA